MNKSILSARQIHKTYVMGKSIRLDVLKGVDIDIRQGEILAIMGPSGVGKSTLLHILGALDRPSQGKVFLSGTDVFSVSDESLARFRNLRIGFVFQFHHLLPEFTALENVAMPALIARQDFKRILPRAKSLLKDVGLSHRQNHKPREMSGGEQQRVAFARALVNDPVLILADEPSGNLDLANSKALHNLMWKHVRQLNKTFVVVTHNQELADSADRIIYCTTGKFEDKLA
jgi:lipoprotein-releasing system ATP-binding protein